MDADSKNKPRLWIEYLIVLTAVGILYYISVAPGVLWQDSGLAQIRVVRHDFLGTLGLALAHPLYYLIAHAFQLLPFSDSAYKTNLVSATFASLTIANIYILLSMLLRRQKYYRLSAIIAAISLALAHTFWQHAALAEVYSVSTFLITCELLALVKFTHTWNIRWYLLAWFLCGLEWSNHNLALINAAAVAIWSISLIRNQHLKLKWIPIVILLWIIGGLPYEYLCLQSFLAGNPLPEVIRSMLFGKYRKQVLNLSLGMKMLFTSIGVIGLNFPTANIFLIPVGWIQGKKQTNNEMYLLLMVLTLLHLAFAVRYPVVDQYTFFIVPILFLSIWIGIGASVLINAKRDVAVILIIFALIPPVIYYHLPAIIQNVFPKFGYKCPIPYRDEARYFFLPWKTGYNGPTRLAEEIASEVPRNSIVIADGTSSRPLIYYQLTKKLRTDLQIVNHLFINEPVEKRIKHLDSLLKKRNVYVIRPHVGYCPKWILDNFKLTKFGPIYRITNEKIQNKQ